MRRWGPPAAALLGAALAWMRGHGTIAVIVVIGAGALLVLGALAPERMAQFDRALVRGVRAVLRLCAIGVGIVVVVPLWAVHRAVRVDPVRVRGSGGWARLHGAPSAASYSPVPARSAAERWRVRGGLLLGTLAVVGLIVVGSPGADGGPEAGEQEGGIPYRAFAFADEPWGRATMDEYYQTSIFAHDETLWQQADFVGEHHNVDDGVRRSWMPEDPTLTVWFVGGSTMFGVGQRDEHTIPSMVARSAAEDGIAIEPVNLGVTGFVSWQETALVRRELTRRTVPDLIVVYHGSNDLGTLVQRATAGIEPLERPGNLLQLYVPGMGPPPGGAPISDTDEIVDAGLTILREEDRAMRSAADDAGVPLVAAWQPSLWSGGPNRWDARVIAENGFSEAYLDQVHDVEDGIVAGLPEVIDLRTALDDAAQPTFYDTVHTNEFGVAIVADALWDAIAPQVRLLAAES